MQAAIAKPVGRGENLSREPQSYTEAMVSPEWSSWDAVEGAKIGGTTNKDAWSQVPRPEGKMALAVGRVSARKIGKHGGVVKHK